MASISQSALASNGHTEAEPSAPFTPGPWHVDPCRADSVMQALGPPIARAYAPRFHGSRAGRRDGGAQANARLIAAAPDMYEALADLVCLLCDVAPEYAESTVAANARAALSKALGE